jgi:chromate transporter
VLIGKAIELFWAFLLVGLTSFGGGYAMIPLVERELIAGRGWIDSATFTEVIAVAEMTPGPVAVNAATFIGHQIAGVLGGLVSTAAVLVVPALVSGSLAFVLARYGKSPRVVAVLQGLRPAACALLFAAALTVLKTVPVEPRSGLVALLAALALYRRVNPLLVIAGAGALGLLLF